MNLPRIVSSALNPVRLDGPFVNRNAEIQLIADTLEANLEVTSPSPRVVVYGEKGIGKTHLSREALREMSRRLSGNCLIVEIDGRGLGYSQSLREVARQLTTRGLGFAGGDDDLRRTLEELGQLAQYPVITETTVDSIARKYGAQAGLSGGLIGTLQVEGKFQWEETRQVGQQVARQKSVSDGLLHTAIRTVLTRLHLGAVPVIVFFNDLDQTLPRANPDELREALGKLVQLEPCVQLVNVRHELMLDDLRRESMLSLEILALSPDDMVHVFSMRAEAEKVDVKREALQSAVAMDVARQVARFTGNPWAFLSVLQQAFLSEAEDKVDSRAVRAWVASVLRYPNPELLDRLALAVNSSVTAGDPYVEEDLLTGQRSLPGYPRFTPLAADEVREAERYGLISPRLLYEARRAWRLDPLVEMLRPNGARAP
jgi:hypothetical protein